MSGTVLTDRKGRSIEPAIETIRVETAGPVRTTLCLEGRLPKCKGIRFRARLCFFAGTGLVRVRFTLHNSNRARHRGGLWDLGDPGSFHFRDLSLVFSLPGVSQTVVRWEPELDHPPQELTGEALEIYQDSSGGPNWQSRNHVNWQGRVPCRFQGYRVRTGDEERFGLRASPTVSLQSNAMTITAAVPEFWQQFPKVIEAAGNALYVRLFPHQWDDLFELQGGEQKTHTVWLDFHQAGAAADFLEWMHWPASVHVAPDWYVDSGAFSGLLGRESEVKPRLQQILTEALEGGNSLFARREIIDEYGWRHFGEVYADHENAYHDGPKPVISHYNNQYDMVYGFLLQFVRSGDRRWFNLADQLARHVVDIDVYHTTKDRAAYNGGLFWHTDHYRDAATSTHRSYSRANLARAGGPYGGGPCNEHNYTTGLLHFYYLTGNPLARDAVLSLANWVIHMDDGQQTVLGLLDDGPTGLASRTTQPDYHGPGRGCGNSVNALLDAWLLSGQRRYLTKAEQLIRRSIHPDDDFTALNLLDVERRWSYTVFLLVLARYLDAKAEAGELGYMYAYAQTALVRYARWMADHEEPYFDHPERLEYPTETWAAHEFRKANVLRVAARHAEEPLRARLFERGFELAARAWSDLLRFESRTVARAVAILMTEGVRDAFFRTRKLQGAPRAGLGYDFGVPAHFVSQRGRLLGRLKMLRTIARAVLHPWANGDHAT